MLRTTILPGGLLWLLLFLAAACERGGRLTPASETNDPHYRRGEQLKKQGHFQEALGAYLKVIDKYGDNAPEAHLEAGLLYQQQLKDPLEALHYFRRYLELRPNSQQAELVRQQITAATREFARTLPAQPFENQTARFDLLNRIDQLQKENLQLKEEIAAWRTGRPVPAPAGAVSTPANLAAPPDAVPVVSAGGRPGVRSRVPETAPSPPAPVTGRRHVVVPGDTLMGIAQRYYGSRSKYRDILAANRDLLPNENSPLKPGMELKLP